MVGYGKGTTKMNIVKLEYEVLLENLCHPNTSGWRKYRTSKYPGH